MLESTRALDTMVMDKTGTVTQGRMSLDVEACREVGRRHGYWRRCCRGSGPLGDEALRLAGAVESASEHPVATAITAAARERLGDLPTPAGFSNHEGRGVSATVEGRRVAVGRPGWLAGEMGAEVPEAVRSAVEKAQDSGATAVVLAVGGAGEAASTDAEPPDEAAAGIAADASDTADTSDDVGTAAPDTQPLKAVAVLVVRDTVRPSSRTAVAALRELGIRPVLLTGDNARAAEHVAAQVGIDAADVRAEVLPADKRDVVADLQAQGAVVGMVGDGVNDAAALAQAGTQGLGFAMGSGADVAIEAADITLVRTDLDAAVAAVRVSRETLRIIRQNLFWAFAYNVAAIPLAAAGLLNPMIAGAAMAASSVIVVTNSLRLRRAG